MGSGQDEPHNLYHGGKIFNDTATGLIWIENQVSFGERDPS